VGDAGLRRLAFIQRLVREQRGLCATCPATLIGNGDRGVIFGSIEVRLCRSCRVSQDRRDEQIARTTGARRAA
jgi:hypothetical protein